MISESARFCNRFVTFTFLAYCLVGTSAHISALLRLNVEENDTYFQGNSTCYDYLPYAFTFPLMMAAYVGYDAIFCCLLKCLDTNLQILSLTTKNIRERLRGIDDDKFPEFEEELYNEIKKCNHNLEFLLRITSDIDKVFSMTMLLQCITSTFMMASNFFIASMLYPFDPEFYSLAEYMLAALAQLCMICHFAGIVTHTTSFYNHSLYECNWYSTSKRFKKCILIMMTRMQIPSLRNTLFVIYYMVGGTSHYSAHKRLNEEQPYVYFQNASCYDFMPHYYMIPFQTDTTSRCKMALVIMDLGMGIMGLYIAATRTIRERTLKKLNLSEQLGTFRDDEIPELENGMYFEIRKCNLYMSSLMRTHEDIEDTFCLITLLQTASSLFMIASNLIIASTLTANDPLFWCIVQFIISCMIQLTMYCYFGSSITEMVSKNI
nr:unnamed protein product [Callosobruchus analis]